MVNPHARSTDLTLLHPDFRQAVQQVLASLAAQKLPFALFEGFRYPERQADLYAQGRTAPGKIVTYAPPWSSYHQYGLGVDLVLNVDGQWSWDTSGAKAAWWTQMQATGKQFGLAPLEFEMPHLQRAGTSSNALAGGVYPGGGDETWAENLDAAIMAWKGSPPAPPRPRTVQRPPLS